MAPWTVPSASGRLDAIVHVPGSKSLSARYLVLAALAAGPTRLSGVLRARDTDLMMAALSALGVGIEADGDHVLITPGPMTGAEIECGLAGTVMRFVPPLAALATGTSRFDGDEAARVRPMAPLLDGLDQLGVGIESEAGHLPCRVHGRGHLPGGRVTIDASDSSQFVSAMLLIGPATDAGLHVVATGAVPSRPHIEMTCGAIERFGGSVRRGEEASEWHVAPGGLGGQNLTVEPDLTNAAPFLAAALVAGGRVTIPAWPASTTQGGARFPDLIARMGARVSRPDPAGRDSGTLAVEAERGTPILGIEEDLSDCGELVPTVAALAALASTPSRLTGIGHLRGHETDRLAALVREVNKLGGAARELPDGLAIDPAPRALRPAQLAAYGDHRMATFAAIVGLRVAGTTLDDIGSTAKTLPTFPALWAQMLGSAA